MSPSAPEAPTPAWRPGLKFHDHGNAGVVVATTDDLDLACSRHERVAAFVRAQQFSGLRHPGGLLLLRHVVDNLVLLDADLWLACGEAAVIYRDGTDHYIEWANPHGWLSRRRLSPATVTCIHAKGTWLISRADRQWAARALRQLAPEARGENVWAAFLSDAQAWWCQHIGGPLRDHALGLRPLQVLHRTDFARGLAGPTQISAAVDEANPQLPDMADFPPSGLRSGKTSTIGQLQTFAASVKKQRPSKADACRIVAEHITLLMPLAAGESQACLHGLGAFRHALVAGGAQGGFWAAVTIVEYLRAGLEPVVHAMLHTDPDTLDGAAFHAIYARGMQTIEVSQRNKYAAFVHVFHRYMVIAGAEPLPWPMLPGAPLLPPAAAVVHPADFEAALQYVTTRAPSEQVRLQATIILRLGMLEPMRTYEFWCLRVGDVQTDQDLWLVIYPRPVDGICKSPYLRRVADIRDLALRRDLLALQSLRREADAGDEDVLFGVAGEPLARHEEKLTKALTNAALRWATGKHSASIYDLRHTCFSARAAATL